MPAHNWSQQQIDATFLTLLLLLSKNWVGPLTIVTTWSWSQSWSSSHSWSWSVSLPDLVKFFSLFGLLVVVVVVEVT